MKAIFLRLLEEVDKESALSRAAGSSTAMSMEVRFDATARELGSIPGSPFAYWVTPTVRSAFRDFRPFESEGRFASFGASTKNDRRYLRHWCEVPSGRIGLSREETAYRPWVPFSKGGAFSPFYADIHLVLFWHRDGAEIKVDISEYRGARGWGYKWSAALNGHGEYFRPGLTWPRRTQGGLSLREMPRGCIFGDKGPAALVAGDDSQVLLALLATTNSHLFVNLVSLQMAFGSYEVGVIQRTPVPAFSPADESALASLARRAWSVKRSLDTRTENSHAFSLPALLQFSASTLAGCAAAWADRVRAADTELAAIQAEIDDRCFDLYGINEEDRKAITKGFGGATEAPPSDEIAAEGASASDSSFASEAAAAPASPAAADDDSDPNDSDESASADATGLTADLLSWSIGIAVGRFDVRLATGERALPPEPDPFGPLPVCSPGMLTSADGLPCATSPSGYPIDIPQDGVLLDDPGHPRDLTASARAVFDVVFGGDADARWQEAAGILDPKNHDLRAFVARTFFELHLKRYSKSRRKAPIYWQLATPSASYSVWLYAHRLTPDTFFHVLHDVVAPKLGLEERKLLSLTQEFGPNPTASQRKEIAAEESFVDELRAFRDEVTRVAPLWKPDLDDGVLLTMAPLWRLVPQHRAWQKELKTAWESLSAGEYDWAHVAMHLWPERVVPKCATDRSLAIAHGLEDGFWEEGAKGKWTTCATPQTPVADLVAERTSPAVKSALKDLLEAPQNRGANKGTRKGRTDA